MIKFLNILKDINADNIQTILQITMSNGQWTQTIILDTTINIAGAKNRSHIFLYQAKNNEVKNANQTQAWSEGNDASGIWSRSNFQTPSKTVSGLSISTKAFIT